MDDDLHADELQRDVGHDGEHAGDGDGEFERAGAVAAMDDVGRRDVAVLGGNGPELGHDGEDDGIDDDRVGQGEEAVGADGIDQGRHGDDGIGGVEVAADEEPGDPGAELAPAEAPFVEMGEGGGAAPAGGDEAHGADKDEEEDEDAAGDRVEVGADHAPVLSPRQTSQVRKALTGTQAS